MEFNLGTIFKALMAVVAAAWGALIPIYESLPPLVLLLLALMILDITTGLIAGGKAQTIDSKVAYFGMRKKGLILCLVVMAAAVEHYTRSSIPGLGDTRIPILEALAGFFASSEAISILENAANAGVPIPAFLRDILARLSPTMDGNRNPE